MTHYQQLLQTLASSPKTWLITGVAGFIGSNLLETLLKLEQRVVGLDNFATGFQHNLDEVQGLVKPAQWANFRFIKGDIRQQADCQKAMIWHPTIVIPNALHDSSLTSVDYVLHQAALGSVPRSLADPIATNASNITGFLNILMAARDAKVQSFTYAASSSTYGDHPALPKVEENIGKPLSPYAVTKYVNELYADVFSKCYGFHTIGLRYFNVFGPRQNPNGAYAAVIPKWIDALLKGEPVYINGDGETSRDFSFVANTIQANLLAATAANPAVKNQIYNVALGDRTTLNQLFFAIKGNFAKLTIAPQKYQMIRASRPTYRDFREGDVMHSQADISKIQNLLGYKPMYPLEKGIEQALPWYVHQALSA